MNAQDQADNLHASSIGPIPSLNDFDPTNHTVRERPEDLNQHDLDLRKNQEELSPSKSGRNCLRPAYARKPGSRKNYLRLVYARKAPNKDDSLTLFEVATYLRNDGQKPRLAGSCC
ncbi:hypothetical protein BHE90_017505 [Fusarium euwallaceae]|uniref:Uncharacterized protein n=1 Tax=Fusarium euwallaceae TaxID=1147111 RepID=A0A430KXB7_9HYPO|nr:hypothetical protein BHE90_017505 [Fusarium euwallaceae]